jgi:uncharacterized protein YndB with AHSA1/START domain
MPRTDVVTLEIEADIDRVAAALVDPDALATWLPPPGMSGRFERFDLRPGGGYRLVLTYDAADDHVGKSGGGEDVVEAVFTEIELGRRVVQAVTFVSDDPAFAGTMTMAWEVAPIDGDRTLVTIRADGVPDGISADDHAEGMHGSLRNLAAYVTS